MFFNLEHLVSLLLIRIYQYKNFQLLLINNLLALVFFPKKIYSTFY